MFDYKYQKLAEQLKTEILQTYTTPGKKIPTEHELCERFSLSRNTVRQAIGQLVDKGFLVKIQGCGTFVTARVGEFVDKKRNARENRSIGVVMNKVNAYIFPSVLTGISDYLFQRGYHMMLRMTQNQVAKERQVLEELLAADLAGLIIEPTRSSLPQANEDLYRTIEKTIPCVLVNSVLPGFSFPAVDTANVEGYMMLVDYLVERGHRDIAGLFKFDEQTGVKRYQGFCQGCIKHGLRVDEKRILWYGDEDFETIFLDQNAHRVMNVIRNCSAIMCFNDEIAEKLLPFLDKRGIAVPQNVSVVAFDDCWSTPNHHPVTTIEHPKERLGHAAARAALALLEDPLAKATNVFPPRLVEYSSVLKLAGAGITD